MYKDWKSDEDKEKIKLEQRLKKEEKTDEEIEKLDREIAYRISKTFTSLNFISSNVSHGRYDKDRYSSHKIYAVEASFSILRRMASLPPENFPALYSEYSDASLPMLLSELLRKSTNEEDKQKINLVSSKLLDFSSSYTFRADTQKSSQEIAAETIHQDFLITRWKTLPFKYLSCDLNKPLC